MDIAHNPQSFYPFIFQNIQLKEACWVDNEPYFTRRAIGEWLEYQNPQKRIDGIIAKNPHINQFSVTLKLRATDGKEYDQHVYNPIGLQLIVFESRQPKARAYKIMVAHLVYAFMKGELSPPHALGALRKQIQREEILKLPTSFARGSAVRHLGKKYKVNRATIYRWIKRVRQGEGLERKPYPLKGIYKVVLPGDVEMISMIVEQDPEITVREIRERMPHLACSSTTVNTVKRRIKEHIK